jgi:hypothetical protein
VAEAPGGGAEFEVRLPLGETETETEAGADEAAWADEADPTEVALTLQDRTDQSLQDRTDQSPQGRTHQSPRSHQDRGHRAAVADAVPGGDDL